MFAKILIDHVIGVSDRVVDDRVSVRAMVKANVSVNDRSKDKRKRWG